MALVEGQCREHLCCALRVTDVCQILVFGYMIQDSINHGWQVVFAHFIKAVVKELRLIHACAKVLVMTAIDVASIVTKPNIEPTIQKLESK